MSAEKDKGTPRSGIVIEVDSKKEFITQREIDVLQLRANGLGITEIAGNLNISETAVSKHLSRIFDKLDVESLTEAIVIGAEKQMIDVIRAVEGLDINKVRELIPIQKAIMEKVIEKKGSLPQVRVDLSMSKNSLSHCVFNIDKTLGLKSDGHKKHENKFYRAALLYMAAKKQGKI